MSSVAVEFATKADMSPLHGGRGEASSGQPPALPNGAVLYLSRGKGRGHAVPDAAIAGELLKLEPALDITFASYSVGAETLRELGHDVVDLELPEDNPLWDNVLAAMRVLRERAWNLVVSHEEFTAVPLARSLDIPCLFLTDWFAHPDSIQMQSLRYAEEILFLDEPGYYDEPGYLSGKVRYVGPVLRPLRPEETGRERARAKLGIPDSATVITVVPGGAAFHSEDKAPLAGLILETFDRLDFPEKRLVWVVGDPDHGRLAGMTNGRADILLLKPHWDFTPTLVASDLLITKGNRLPLLEAEVLGIPSVSISYGYNPVDDHRVALIHTNTALRARGLTPDSLRTHLLRALERGNHDRRRPINEAKAAGAAATLLYEHIRA